MARLKKIRAHLCCIAVILGCLFVHGCEKKSGLTVEGYDAGVVFEYMTDAIVPPALINGVSAEERLFSGVKYKFISPEYEVKGETYTDTYESDFPEVYCNRVGEWTVDYIYGETIITKTFEVKDTIAPTLTLQSRPYDVWVSQEKQQLPVIVTEDVSDLDYNSMEKSVTINGKEVSVDAMDKYLADASGELKYTFTIKDIHGNEAKMETCWNVKDRTWVDKSLTTGYLADFDSADYVNCVESGYVGSYWSRTQVSEEYLEEFEGQKGVLKITAPVNSSSMGAFKVRLSKSTTAAELLASNKYIVVMMYTSKTNVRIGCEKWSEKSGGAHNFVIDVKPNCWNKIVLSTADLKYGFDDRGTDISLLQFCFGDRNNLESGELDLYLASITTADYLPALEEVNKSDKTITWQAVKGADGYEVTDNGKTKVVQTTKYTCSNKNNVIVVRPYASDDNVLKLTSKTVTPYIDKSKFAENDIATMNSAAYTYLFRLNDFNSARRGASLKAEYLSEYKGEKGVIKVTTVNNDLAVGIGDMVMDLMGEYPEGITVRYMIESSDAKYLRFVQPHTEYGVDNLGDLKTTSTWQTEFLNYDRNYTENPSDEMILMTQGGTPGASNVVYFSFVKKGNCLAEVAETDREQYREGLLSALTGTQLASFNNEAYTMFVEQTNPAYGKISTEWLESYKGEKGVLKISLTPNNAERPFFAVKLALLGEMKDGLVIKYRLEQEKDTPAKAMVWRLLDSNNSVGGSGGVNVNQTFNKWLTETVEISSLVKQTDAIALFGAGYDTKTTYNLYIANIDNYIKE